MKREIRPLIAAWLLVLVAAVVMYSMVGGVVGFAAVVVALVTMVALQLRIGHHDPRYGRVFWVSTGLLVAGSVLAGLLTK